MDRNEAVQKLAIAGRLSIAHAEDLYDSFFPKPVVPQYVADWYEKHKDNLEDEIYYLIRNWDDKERTSDFCKWFDDTKNEAIKTLVNMHQFGYEVEKEKRYLVKMKGIAKISAYLNLDNDDNRWYWCDNDNFISSRTHHTRKELEDAGFGEVFNNPLFEVKEVK